MAIPATKIENEQTPADSSDALDSRPSNGLPSPLNFPHSDVVIYDGNCVFCSGQVKNLMRLDGKNRLSFVSLHAPFVSEHFPDLSHEQLMDQIYLIPNVASNEADTPKYSSARLGGAAALKYLTRRLPKIWIFAPFLHIPFTLPIWQWGYKQIAKRRYKIAGKSDGACDEDGTCELHFKD